MRASALAPIAACLLAAASCATPPPKGTYDDDGAGDGDGDGDGDLTPDPEACKANSAEPAQPFGSHHVPYAKGAILPNHVDQATLDAAVTAYYDRWKPNWIEEGCGDDSAYLAAHTTDTLMTVSEAHGYGMLILAYMAGHDPDAHRLFDGFYRYYRDHTAGGNLMSWAQGADCTNKEGNDSATDGDLDVAYALLLADKQWGSGGDIDYRSAARTMIDDIWSGDVHTSGKYTLLGNWVSPGDDDDSTRTSDFMPGHFTSFAKASGDDKWEGLSDATYTMLKKLQDGFAPDTGLIPDFVVNPVDDPKPAPPNFLETEHDGEYSYNACRDPMRIGIHFLVSGDKRAHDTVERINDFVEMKTGGNPDELLAGFSLDGDFSREFIDMAVNAPIGVGTMVDASHQDFLNALWDQTTEGPWGGYFGDTLSMISLIAMSGNWWAPEAVDCPPE